MRGSVYDWIRQTPQHGEYARQAYPLIHELASETDSWNDYCHYAQNLPPTNRLQYVAEEKKWRTQFGDAWKAMGCIRETSIGQRSTGRTVYGGRTRNSLMGLGAMLRTPSYPRNVISGLGAVMRTPSYPRNITGFSGGLGAISNADVKLLQMALNEQYLTPANALVVDGVLGAKTCKALHWFQYEYKGINQAAIDPSTYAALDLPSYFGQQYAGICTGYYSSSFKGTPPSETGTAMSKADAKALQTALNEQYLTVENALTVDGIVGSKTCYALHWFQYEYLGIDRQRIDPATYAALGLPAYFGQKYPAVCLGYYTGVYNQPPPSSATDPNLQKKEPAPTFEEPEPPPVEQKAGFNKYLLIGAVAILGGGLIAWKVKGKKGKRR